MNKESVERLWDEITPKLYGYLVNTLKNRTLADDILQTTWLKAIEAMPNFKERGHGISAWIFSIARNEMRMHWRKGGREIPYDPILHDQTEATLPQSEIFMEQIISKLPMEDQELLKLRYISDLPLGTIGKILGLNPINVRVKMHRALARARDSLKTQI